MDKAVFDEYYPKIYNYVYYRVLHKETTEDIVSEVFYKAIAFENTFDGNRASYKTWIFTIAHNCVVNFYRNEKVTESLDGFEFKAPESDILNVFVENEDIKWLYELLKSLTERERIIIALRYWGEFSYKEIAGRIGLSQTNVSTILSRAIEKLRLLW